MKILTGQCLCGAIAYEVKGELGPIVNCHCSKCRRWHDAPFRTRAVVASKDFKWLKGEEHLSKYNYGSADNKVKTFCSICGSNLISFDEEKPDYIRLPIAGLDQDPGKGHRPLMNIFVKDKAPWYEITDGLPQYDEWPPAGSDSVRVIEK